MAQAHASHGASKVGLKLIQRRDFQLNPAIKAKHGGFATVHQGTFNGEVVAVKTPRDSCSLTEKQFKEFVRELTVMANVKHPHCVTLLAACDDRADPFLVMEWMCGGHLFEALGRDDPHALPWHVRLRIAREIASAIEFLHICKISHGDLKSMNVLLTSDFVSKICDFGAAIQRLNSTAIMGSKAGAAATLQYTLHYSAPELLVGSAANSKTDMYAFGIIMYELLTCKTPFEGVNASLLPHLIVKEGLRPQVPHPQTSQFPPAFFDVMQLCWHPDPALRPTAQAVHKILISIDPSARPSAPLVLYPNGHAAPRRSVLDCLRAAMSTSSAVESMLSQMMNRADYMFKSDVEVQSLCAEYCISLAEAHAIMVCSLVLPPPFQRNCSSRFTLWMASSSVSVPKTLLTTFSIQPAESVNQRQSSAGRTSRFCFAQPWTSFRLDK
jgi:serine/threonine protein kinase